MSFAIIHLTDVHVSNGNDFILDKAEKIFDVCTRLKEECGVVEAVIVVTGDLSYSGDEVQLKLSCDFLKNISSRLSSFFGKVVDVVAVPGNHDCDFTNEHCQKVRSVILEKIHRNAIDGFDIDFVSEALLPQKNYFSCVSSSFISLTEKESISRYVVLDFSFGKVCFLLYNTAWISERHEKPGTLCMPINLISSDIPVGADLYISLAHHPLHWLNPDNMVAFRSIIRSAVDIAIWGHEHLSDIVQEHGDDWNLYSFEGKELQENGAMNVSNFAVYVIDDVVTKIKEKFFSWSCCKNKYVLQNEFDLDFKRNLAQSAHGLFPNERMMRELNDYGVLIHHPCKDNIFFDDLFVWPDLFCIDLKDGDDTVTVSARNELEKILAVNITLIVGAEATGKTALSKRLYRSFLSYGKCCLLVRGEDLSARSNVRLKSQIESFFSEQYNCKLLSLFNSLDLEDKVLIIDDFDGLIQSNKKYNEVIDFLKCIFGSIVLFTGVDINVTYIITQLKSSFYRGVSAYRIKYFGNARRHDLIEKWYSITEVIDVVRKGFLISRALGVIDDFIEKFSRIVPATPLLIVTVLQTIDSSGDGNFTRYSYMYEQLVQRSLNVISCDDQAMQSVFVAILSNMAYEMLIWKKRYIVSSDLINVVEDYRRKKLLNFNPATMIERLSSSGILVLFDENKYRFRYPYMYYYFAALYVSRNLTQDYVKNFVDYMSEHLFVEDYGNIMIFVCHFTNSEYVIDNVLTCALCALDQFDEFDFSKPNELLDGFNDIIDQQMKMLCVGDEDDVDTQRKNQLERMDARGIKDGSVVNSFDGDINDEPMDIADIVSAIRVIGVIGQILKNYPGEIDGEKKIDLISGISNLAMRVIGVMYLVIGKTRDEFIKFLTEAIREADSTSSLSQISYRVKRMFASLIFGTACGMLHIVSKSIGSSVLLPAIRATKDKYPEDLSFRLICADTSMLSFGDNWYKEVLSLGKSLKQNKLEYAYQTMRFLVAGYLRTNHCRFEQRNALCDTYELSKNRAFSILPKNTK